MKKEQNGRNMENNIGINKNEALAPQDDRTTTISASSGDDSDSINGKDIVAQIAGEEVITESRGNGQPGIESNVNEPATDSTTEDPVSKMGESKSANEEGHTHNLDLLSMRP